MLDRRSLLKGLLGSVAGLLGWTRAPEPAEQTITLTAEFDPDPVMSFQYFSLGAPITDLCLMIDGRWYHFRYETPVERVNVLPTESGWTTKPAPDEMILGENR